MTQGVDAPTRQQRRESWRQARWIRAGFDANYGTSLASMPPSPQSVLVPGDWHTVDVGGGFRADWRSLWSGVWMPTDLVLDIIDRIVLRREPAVIDEGDAEETRILRMVQEDLLAKRDLVPRWQRGCLEFDARDNDCCWVSPAPPEAIAWFLSYVPTSYLVDKLGKTYVDPPEPPSKVGREGRARLVRGPLRPPDPALASRAALDVAILLIALMRDGATYLARSLDSTMLSLASKIESLMLLRLDEVNHWIAYGLPTADGSWVRPLPPDLIAAMLGVGPLAAVAYERQLRARTRERTHPGQQVTAIAPDG